MKRGRAITLIIGTIIAFVGLLIGVEKYINYKSQAIYKEIIAYKKMYCYETYYMNVVNPVLYVRDTLLVDSLKKFYKGLETTHTDHPFNFGPLLVPLDTCVYVLGYSKDSSIAKIQFFYKFRYRHLSAIGYVYSKTLHSKRISIHRKKVK